MFFWRKTKEVPKPREEVDVNEIVKEWRSEPSSATLLFMIQNYVVKWDGNFFKNMDQDNRQWVWQKLTEYIKMREG